MSVKRISGSVTLTRDGTSKPITGETGIETGDQIATAAEGGRAELRLEGNRRVELAPGSRIEVAEAGVTGLEGSVLAEPRSGDRLFVRFGEARALSSRGVFRVDLGLGSSRIGVYEGGATVGVPGQEPTTVDPLFQVGAAANARILAPSPLRISEQDPWDQLELEDVLRLDGELERLGAGLATQLGGARPALDYFSLLADQKVGWLSSHLDERVPDLMIGFSIARTSAGRLKDTFRRARSLHEEGGRWGLIAAILEARERALLAELGRTILSSGVLAGGSAGEGPTFAAGPAQEAASSTSGSPGSGGTTSGAPPPSGGQGPGKGGGEPTQDPCADPLANPQECVEEIGPPIGGGSNGGDGGKNGATGGDEEDGGLIEGLLDTADDLIGDTLP
jgi:hypothetical protein